MAQDPDYEKSRWRYARLLYAAVWLVVVLFVALSETDVLPVGYIKDGAGLSYALHLSCIVLTLASTWGALRLPAFARVKRACEERRGLLPVLYMLRTSWLGVAALLDAVIYYGLLDGTTPLYCLLIAVVGLMFCRPSREA